MSNDHPPTDGELLTTFAADRSDSAFTALVERHRAMVEGVCRRVLGDHHEAQDVAQAVFLTLARHAAKLARRPAAGGWLHVVAWRLAVKARRTHRRRQAREEAVRRDRDLLARTPVEPPAVSAELDAALGQLPERYRLPLVLFHLEARSLEQTAGALGLKLKTASTRLVRGRELLRRKLVRQGVAVYSPGELAALLAAAATSATLPGAFVAATVKAAGLAAAGKLAAGAGVVSPQVAAFTDGAVKMLFWTQVKTVAAVAAAVLAAAAVPLSIALARAGDAAPQPVAAAPAAAPTPASADDITVVPRDHSAVEAFAELRRQGGPRVVWLGETWSWSDIAEHYGIFDPSLTVPAKLRFKPIAGRELLAAVAATRDLKIAWVRADRCAVLYEGAAAAEIERVREDLAAPDLAIRRAAAWRGGWLRDPQMVSPLVQAARSADAEVARQARLSLRRLGWAAVVAIDAGALEVIATDVAEGGLVGQAAVETLGQAAADGGAEAEKAVALCEKTLADPRPWKRRDTIRAMAEAGGKQALPFLDKALADPDISVRQMATHCLGRVGREPAVMAAIEKALADPDAMIRAYALSAMVQADKAKAAPLLMKALADPTAGVREVTVSWVVEVVGGDQAVARLEKALADPDRYVRLDLVRKG